VDKKLGKDSFFVPSEQKNIPDKTIFPELCFLLQWIATNKE